MTGGQVTEVVKSLRWMVISNLPSRVIALGRSTEESLAISGISDSIGAMTNPGPTPSSQGYSRVHGSQSTPSLGVSCWSCLRRSEYLALFHACPTWRKPH